MGSPTIAHRGDHVDLHHQTRKPERARLDRGDCGESTVRKESRANRDFLGEFTDVTQVVGHLHDVAEVGAAPLEHGADVEPDLLALFGQGGSNDAHVLVKRDLTGKVDGVAVPYRVGVRLWRGAQSRDVGDEIGHGVILNLVSPPRNQDGSRRNQCRSRAATNASVHASMSAVLCDAHTCTRMRALPIGTTGYENATT